MIHYSELDEYGKHIVSLQCEPLKITASLTSAFVTTDYIFFDSLISSAVWQDCMKEKAYNIPENKSELFYIPLPIMQVGTKEPFYAASIGFPKLAIDGVARWRKQTDIESKKKISIGSGEFKRYDMPIPYTSAEEIVFYANGNKDEIERLLQFIPSIGKKRTQGYGNVRVWKVERTVSIQRTLQKELPPYIGENKIEAKNYIVNLWYILEGINMFHALFKMCPNIDDIARICLLTYKLEVETRKYEDNITLRKLRETILRKDLDKLVELNLLKIPAKQGKMFLYQIPAVKFRHQNEELSLLNAELIESKYQQFHDSGILERQI